MNHDGHDGRTGWREATGRVAGGIAAIIQIGMGLYFAADDRPLGPRMLFGNMRSETLLAFTSSLMLVIALRDSYNRKGLDRLRRSFNLLDLIAFTTAVSIQLAIQQYLRR